jgi:hypothetical protein
MKFQMTGGITKPARHLQTHQSTTIILAVPTSPNMSSFVNAAKMLDTQEFSQKVADELLRLWNISNNPSFRLKHPGVPDGSDGSDGTSYPLTENYTLPVAQATGRVA